MVRSIVLAGLIIVLPLSVRAQGHGAFASAPHAMAAARVPMMHAMPSAAHGAMPTGAISRPAVGARMAPRNGVERPRVRPAARTNSRPVNGRRNFDVGGRRDFDADNRRKPGCSSVPGLGFDEVHLAAVCGVGSGDRGFGFGSPFFFPFFDSGFYMPGTAAQETIAPEGQQPEGGDPDSTEIRRRARDSRPAPVVQADNTPVPDTEQYVFVRRDGTVFFAVAYAWDNGTLRYVTSEGLRRNIETNALDLAATQQFNEQRGLSFHLPA